MSDDHIAITQVINRYGLAVDCQAWSQFDTLFTDDVVADYGGPELTGLDTFRTFAAQVWGQLDSSIHAMSTTVVELRGDAAHTMTYGSWVLGRFGVRGGDWWEGTGWYADEFARTAAGWRIRRRTCRVVHWTGNPNLLNPDSDSPGPATHSLSAAYRAGSLSIFS